MRWPVEREERKSAIVRSLTMAWMESARAARLRKKAVRMVEDYRQFTRAVAADWAVHQITVNAILPGGFMTEPNRRWSKTNPEVIERFRANIPLGDFGQPEDLGPLAVYLASDASHYMTGAALVIDGGYTLW
jgi:NAD(P)-dependent dehydrogenase (short-subunit alcohol dehydrogenase family)